MRTAAALLLGAALLATGVEASYAYFVIWGQNPLVRTLYHHHVVALGRHLDASPAQLPAVITSLTPGEFHDPYTMEVTLRREDLTLRWVNGQGALFFPDGQSRLYVEAQSALHPLLTPGAMPDAAPLLIAPGAQGRTVQGCTWDAEAVWQELLAEAETTVDVAPGDPPPGQPHAAASLPVVYGGRAALVGYRVVPATSQEPGTTLSVLTVWEVRAPSPEELVLFSHLLDASGNLGVQADRLDAPTWQWAAGDRFAQVHTLTLPEDLPPGEYGLAVGLYARETLARLPLAAEPGATRVLIPLEITPPGVKSEN